MMHVFSQALLFAGVSLSLALTTQTPIAAAQPAESESASVTLGSLAGTASNLQADEAIRVTGLPLHDGPLTSLDLTRFEIKVPGTRTHVNGPNGAYRLPVSRRVHLVGSVEGSDSSWAYLSVTPKGNLSGLVRDRGRTFALQQKAIVARETPALLVHELGAGQLAKGALEPSCGVSGPLTLNQPSLLQKSRRLQAAAPTPGEQVGGFIDIAIETDFELYDLFQDVQFTEDYVETLFGAVAAIYRTELGARLRLADVYLHTAGADADPWEENGNLSDAASEVRSWWNTNRWRYPRSLVHFLTGKTARSGGYATIASLCSQERAYGISAVNGASIDPEDPVLNYEVYLVAHELGHNVGAVHTHETSVFDPVIDQCNLFPYEAPHDGGTIMSYCNRAPGGMANINPSFGEEGKYGHQSERSTNQLLWWIGFYQEQGCLGSEHGIKLFEEPYETGLWSMWSEVVENGMEGE